MPEIKKVLEFLREPFSVPRAGTVPVKYEKPKTSKITQVQSFKTFS